MCGAAGRRGGGTLMARARGLASWQPRAKSLALLDQVNAVLDEYRDHLPLTIRQIFYRLVGAYGYPKGTSKDRRPYLRLGEMLNRARLRVRQLAQPLSC
jgi:hypothetical protein